MTQASTSGWKKWFAVGLGFGAGAVGATGIILGCFAWYSSRPQLWDTRDIKATFSMPLFVTDGNSNITGIELEYVIDNNTSRDFTLTPEQPLFVKDGGALRRSDPGSYKIADKCFVPAKNKVRCQITAPASFDTTNMFDGFALFDNVSRYNILFPKPTGPTPDQRKKFISDFQKKPEKAAQQE
jgi:hypothetical protein